MKIVLRHTETGRYYNGPGRWVRRADNALVFDDMSAAREFSRANHLDNAQPVQRLAPYMMELLRAPNPALWERCARRNSSWLLLRSERFSDN